MNMNDIIYFSSLLMTLSLGSHYKDIDKIDMKRNYGAGLGLLIAFLICGHYILHTFIMVWGNVLILKTCDRRYVHQISLAFSWTYLLYLHYNVPTHSYVISIFQVIALRLVGLACELSIVEKPRTNVKDAHTNESEVMTMPEAVDILSYAYFFVGIHKGPYYRWRIFKDHLNTQFNAASDYRSITEDKVKKAVMCALGYLLLRTRFNTQMYEEHRFYLLYGTDYRYLFNIPLLLMFYLNTEMIALLCAGVCTESGFGIYPSKCTPPPGSGPSNPVANLAKDTALQQDYNVEMLNSFEVEKLLLGPKMKDTMRGWDMSVRYWYWSYGYKKFIKASKQVRSAFSFMLWTLWCGPSIPHFIISTTLWVTIHLEDEYSLLYDTDGSMKLPWDIGFSIMRMFCLLYLTPCFVVDETRTVLKYYNSIYWMYHIILSILILIAVIIVKTRDN